ncbi:hypothetical protein [Streptomyces sp. NPDC048350]|uniref:hypothetical protein n=1 Tax=Streptomyces sp. NPDC048350 TaxID=3365538 RepID=UPI0037169506
MQNFKITWAQAGQEDRRESAVSYSAGAVEAYAAFKAVEEGVSEVQVVEEQLSLRARRLSA